MRLSLVRLMGGALSLENFDNALSAVILPAMAVALLGSFTLF